MTNWYDKYINLPYKHLGNDPITGIDCFNLCRYVYLYEKHIDIPYISYEHCNIVDDDWYNKTTQSFFEQAIYNDQRWQKVTDIQPFDFLLMSIGSTNVANHCSIYLGNNKILQTMIGRKSWIAPYGRYYQQYTLGIYRWTL